MSATTGVLVLAALREGPKTTTELIAATGSGRNAVLCSLYWLTRRGHHVENLRHRGGHDDGLYRLVYDREYPGRRSCSWPGCGKRLNRHNPGPYCLYHRGELVDLGLSGDRRLIGKDQILDLMSAASKRRRRCGEATP